MSATDLGTCTRDAILAELYEVKNKINDLYWTFTRTKRGVPPCIAPGGRELYARQSQLEGELARRRRERVR